MIFNFLRGPVGQIISTIAQNSGSVTDVRETVKKYIPTVKGSWIGGDEEAFEQDVTSRLVPAIQDFINSLVGLNTNTSKASGIMDGADAKAKGEVGKLADVFKGI